MTGVGAFNTFGQFSKYVSRDETVSIFALSTPYHYENHLKLMTCTRSTTGKSQAKNCVTVLIWHNLQYYKWLHRLLSWFFKNDFYEFFANGSLSMDVENPGELFQVLLNNPASRIAAGELFYRANSKEESRK